MNRLIFDDDRFYSSGVYNGANYLTEQLESYLRQARLPDELAAVNDGSTGETGSILADFPLRAGFPVRIIMNVENIGIIESFEKRLQQCRPRRFEDLSCNLRTTYFHLCRLVI